MQATALQQVIDSLDVDTRNQLLAAVAGEQQRQEQLRAVEETRLQHQLLHQQQQEERRRKEEVLRIEELLKQRQQEQIKQQLLQQYAAPSQETLVSEVPQNMHKRHNCTLQQYLGLVPTSTQSSNAKPPVTPTRLPMPNQLTSEARSVLDAISPASELKKRI